MYHNFVYVLINWGEYCALSFIGKVNVCTSGENKQANKETNNTERNKARSENETSNANNTNKETRKQHKQNKTKPTDT